LRLAEVVFELFALGFVVLESAAHAVKRASDGAQLVAANRAERIGKVALFESTNAFDQRVEGLRKCAGNE